MSFSRLIRLDEIMSLPEVPLMERDEGQAFVLNKHILPYLADPSPDYALVLAPSPAFGKTHIMAKIASDLAKQGKHVFWAMPRHDMFNVLQEEVAKTGGSAADWTHWRPRDEVTCKEPKRSAVWVERGNPLFDFCKGMCGIVYMQNECVYHAQKYNPKPIVCGHHNHVFLGHPLMENYKFDVVIGDESPYQSARHDFWIPKWHLVTPETDKTLPLYEILKKAGELPDTIEPVRGKELFDVMGGVKAILEGCRAYEKWEAEKPNWTSERIKHAPPLFQFYDDFVRLIRQDIDSYGDYGDEGIFRVVAWGISLLLKQRRYVHPLVPKHIIWLDATPSQIEYEHTFKRPVKIVKIDVPRVGKVYQVAAKRNNVTKTMRWNDDRTERIPTDLMTEVVMQVDYIVKERGYTNYAVASYKAAKLRFSVPPSHFVHFGGNRGLNALRGDSDAPQALFVIGVPQPPPSEIEHTAHTLLEERAEPFNTKYSPRIMSYEGTAFATDKWDYYDDEILRAILWSKRDAELIQTVHRAGINTRDVDVWIMTSHPIEGLAIDEVLTLDDIFNSPYGISWQRWAEIVGYAEQMAEDIGIVTSHDLAERLGITTKQARGYVKILMERYGWSEVKYVRGVMGSAVIPKWEVPEGLDPQEYYSIRVLSKIATPSVISKALKLNRVAANRYFDSLLDLGYDTAKVAKIPKKSRKKATA